MHKYITGQRSILKVDEQENGERRLDMRVSLERMKVTADQRSIALSIGTSDIGFALQTQNPESLAQLLYSSALFDSGAITNDISSLRIHYNLDNVALSTDLPDGQMPMDIRLGDGYFLFEVTPPQTESRDIMLSMGLGDFSIEGLPDLGAYQSVAQTVVQPFIPENAVFSFRFPDVTDVLWQGLVDMDGALLLGEMANFPPLVFDDTFYSSPALSASIDGQLALNTRAPLDVDGELQIVVQDIENTISTFQQGAQSDNTALARIFVAGALGTQIINSFGVQHEDGGRLFRVTFPADSMPLINDRPLPGLFF